MEKNEQKPLGVSENLGFCTCAVRCTALAVNCTSLHAALALVIRALENMEFEASRKCGAKRSFTYVLKFLIYLRLRGLKNEIFTVTTYE